MSLYAISVQMCFCLLRKQFSLYMHLRGELNYSRSLFSSNLTLLESHLQSLSLDLGILVNISMRDMKTSTSTVIRRLPQLLLGVYAPPPPLHLSNNVEDQFSLSTPDFNMTLKGCELKCHKTIDRHCRILLNKNVMKCGRMESPFIVSFTSEFH